MVEVRAGCQTISKGAGPTLGQAGSGNCAARRYRITPPAERISWNFSGDQPDAGLHFFVGIQVHFSGRPASQSHRQPLAQFSPLGFVSGS
jgi:hypothetical protein